MKLFSQKTQIFFIGLYIIVGVIAFGLFLFTQSNSNTLNTLLGEQNTITSLAVDTFSKNTVLPTPSQPESEKVLSEEIVEFPVEIKKDSAVATNASGIDPLPVPAVTPTPTTTSYTATGCDAGFSDVMISLINAHRSANNVPVLSSDSALVGVACGHSKWMVEVKAFETQQFGHTGLNGTSPFERCDKAGTTCNAENIAFNSGATVQKLFDQFKASPGHNTNMLNPNYTSIGIGYQNGYVTQLFR
jgi:uncharacterized protein YkwD